MLLTAAALGAFHGINPAMGWLFAVALGLQERRLAAVLRALPPIVLGHAASVAVVVVAALLARRALPIEQVRWGAGGALLLLGGYKLWRRSHPRWVGMRVGFRDLTLWSFLMSSAHGAGLMLLPVLLHGAAPTDEHAAHGTALAASLAAAGGGAGLAAFGVHTLALFAVMAAVAVAVFQVVGVEVVRRLWINLDLLWAGALVVAGVVTLVGA